MVPGHVEASAASSPSTSSSNSALHRSSVWPLPSLSSSGSFSSPSSSSSSSSSSRPWHVPSFSLSIPSPSASASGPSCPAPSTAWHLTSFSTSSPPSSSSSSASHATLAPDTTQTQATATFAAEAQAGIPFISAPDSVPAFHDVLEALTTHNQQLETANRALAIFAGRLMQEQTAWLEQQMEQHEAALAHVHSAQAESDRLRAKLAIVEEVLLQRDHQIQSLQILLNQHQELKSESAQGLGLDEPGSAQGPSVACTATQQEARKSQAIEMARDKGMAGQEQVLPVPQHLMERTNPVKAETKCKGKGWWSWWGSMT